MTNKKSNRLITIASVAIPLVVAILLSPSVKIRGYDLTFLPPIYATINAITALLLIVSYINIKRGKRHVHETLMITNMFLGLSFLLMYIAYHITTDSTPYGGEGAMRYLYFVILISHIVLSVTIVPLVLLAYSRARAGNFDKHKKIAKFAWPLWLYVSITGVLVYLMISPYYA